MKSPEYKRTITQHETTRNHSTHLFVQEKNTKVLFLRQIIGIRIRIGENHKSRRSQQYKSQFIKYDLTPLLRNASDTMKSQYTNAILNCEFIDLLRQNMQISKNVLE